MKASILAKSLIALAIIATSAVSFADKDDFAKKHPRRAQVNRRERRQDKKIDKAEDSGKISDKQAKTLEGEEAGIKAQERAEVKANGGYLTKGEQRQLNKEMNGVNRQLKRDEKMDAKKAPADSAIKAQ